jgi:hypothetical protein
MQKASRGPSDVAKTKSGKVKAVSSYLLIHHFPDDFKGSPETAAAARSWFESLGTTLAGRGNPNLEIQCLGSCPPMLERQVAYTLISVETLGAAVAMAEAWPLLKRGGGVEVRELSTTSSIGDIRLGVALSSA